MPAIKYPAITTPVKYVHSSPIGQAGYGIAIALFVIGAILVITGIVLLFMQKNGRKAAICTYGSLALSVILIACAGITLQYTSNSKVVDTAAVAKAYGIKSIEYNDSEARPDLTLGTNVKATAKDGTVRGCVLQTSNDRIRLDCTHQLNDAMN